jgi:hypothetical protein
LSKGIAPNVWGIAWKPVSNLAGTGCYRSDDDGRRIEHTAYNVHTRATKKGGNGVPGNSLVVVHVPCRPQRFVTASTQLSSTSQAQQQLTLLCSHGNAVDVGLMLPVYRELARLLGVNVVG